MFGRRMICLNMTGCFLYATNASFLPLASFNRPVRPRNFRRRLELSNGWQASTQGCRLAGLDQRRGAEINVADMRECADDHNQDRAQEADAYNLQMGSEVGVVHRMV